MNSNILFSGDKESGWFFYFVISGDYLVFYYNSFLYCFNNNMNIINLQNILHLYTMFESFCYEDGGI